MIDDRTFLHTRELPFTSEQIFGAYSDSEKLAAWWGPEGFTNTFEVFEFKPGGSWKFTMHGPNGADYWNECVFESIEPFGTIVIRHDCQPYFTMSIEIVPSESGSLIAITQRFDDAETAARVAKIVGPANEENIDRLTRVLAAHY